MKYLKFLLNAYVFWLAVSIIGSFGCAGLFPYPMADYYPKFICITPVNETSPENNLPLVVTPTTPSGSCAKWNPPLVPSTPGASNISDGLVTNAEVYCKKCRDKENNSTIREIGFDDMRGAGWIQTCYEDRLGRDPNYLVLTFNSLINVEGIYIAYDSKVPSNNRPTWLKDNYIQQKNPVTGAPEYITVNNPDIAGNISTMHIWRFNKTLGNSMTIPGNLYGTPTLPPGIDPKVAMYFVIVNPKKTYKPGPVTLNPYKYDNCTYESTNCNQRDDQERAQCVDDVKNKVTDAAKKDCAQMVGGKTQVCGVTVCYGPYDTCPPPPPPAPQPDGTGQTQSGLKQPYSFRRSSEIEFNPAKYTSKIYVSIEGVQRQYSMDVTGILDFEYILDSHQKMNEIKLNNMLLQGTSSLSTDVGTFSDIIISSVGRVSAACDAVKSVPATYTPCDWYNIPAGDMAISVSAQQDNGRIFMISQSVQPIPINIDQKARTFDLKGGPIMGKINVNGEDKTVGITINVTGHFLNFAPIADASESQKGAECVEKQNGSNIGLYASMSKEIYGDVLPTNPDNYLWFEDFGLVTEKLLGKGRSFPIPPGTLTYGVHYLTLLLYDDHGVSDIDKFKVEVRDTKPPDLTIPGDINLLLRTKKFPVHVDIGKASAFDVCSETDVAIINNSPADGMFPKGDNPVTWTAHDGHGNTTSKIQHVNILTYDKFSRMDVLRGIREGSDRVKSALSENKAKIKECRDIKNCGTNLDSLLSFNKQMITAAGEMPATGKQVRSKRQLIELLEAAGSSLGQANGLLKGKAGRGRGEAEIRSEVMNKLRKAGELMDEVSRRTQPRG